MINEVEKIDQRDLLMILNNPCLFSHIELVNSDDIKNMKIKTFLFTKMVKKLVQASMVRILILQLFKIWDWLFSNWGKQAFISIFRNFEEKIHLEGQGNVMTQMLDKLYEFSLVIE